MFVLIAEFICLLIFDRIGEQVMALAFASVVACAKIYGRQRPRNSRDSRLESEVSATFELKFAGLTPLVCKLSYV